MLNKKMTDAYHKITAPDGLQERIEAGVQAMQEAAAGKKENRIGRWVPQAAALAAAAICLAVLAGGAGIDGLVQDFRLANWGVESAPGVRIALDSGDLLGESRMAVEVISGDGEDLNTMLCKAFSAEQDTAVMTERPSDIADSGDEDVQRALVFQISAEDPVTFSADSECLSTYDEEKRRWVDLKRELMIEREGELCVVLLPMGDNEVFYIQMSSAGYSSRIEIVYDEAAGQYEAACRTNNGE